MQIGPLLTASQLLCAKVVAKGSIKQSFYKWTQSGFIPLSEFLLDVSSGDSSASYLFYNGYNMDYMLGCD